MKIKKGDIIIDIREKEGNQAYIGRVTKVQETIIYAYWARTLNKLLKKKYDWEFTASIQTEYAKLFIPKTKKKIKVYGIVKFLNEIEKRSKNNGKCKKESLKN
jgi:hypothetical protein